MIIPSKFPSGCQTGAEAGRPSVAPYEITYKVYQRNLRAQQALEDTLASVAAAAVLVVDQAEAEEHGPAVTYGKNKYG